MSSFKIGHWRTKAALALMLLSFFAQVNTVFACDMMDYSGPLEECCCEYSGITLSNQNNLDDSSFCCEVSSELGFVSNDLDNDGSVAFKQRTLFETVSSPPDFISTQYYLEKYWLDDVSYHPVYRTWDTTLRPSSLGTDTYLTTQRLRI